MSKLISLLAMCALLQPFALGQREEQLLHTVNPMHSVGAAASQQGTFKDLRVQLEVDGRQSWSSNGIGFDILLINTGVKPVILFSPKDGASAQLIDSKGMVVDISRPVPDSLVHRAGSAQDRGSKITIEAGQRVRIHSSLSQVVAKVEGADGTRTEKLTPLPPGDYELRAQIILIAGEKDSNSGFGSNTYVADPVNVRFGDQ